MSPCQLQRHLIELGWITLIHRALGGKPSASYALHQLLSAAGRPLSIQTIARGYEMFERGGGVMGPGNRGRQLSGSPEGVKKRIERLRAALADLGVHDVVQTVDLDQRHGGGYTVSRGDVPRVRAVILASCGVYEDEGAGA